MSKREQEALIDANVKIIEEITDTIADIGHDIRMEDYEAAEKKLTLLGRLLKTINEGNRRR